MGEGPAPARFSSFSHARALDFVTLGWYHQVRRGVDARIYATREGISVKMGNLFLPVLLIIAGALMLVKTLLNIDIPVFKILLAVALIWGGVSIISSAASHKSAGFGSRMELTDTAMEYTVVFDSSEIDLSSEYISRETLEINCAFGKAVVILPGDRSVHIEASGAFCSLRSPSGRTISFGNGTYDCGTGEPLTIKADCAFGELSFVLADGQQ